MVSGSQFARVLAVVTVRGTREYQGWLGELATFDRRTMTRLVDRDVEHYAEAIGFKKQLPGCVP